MLLAEFGWPQAVTAVGLAFAAAFAWAAFFWALSRGDVPPRQQIVQSPPTWTYERTSVPVDEAGNVPAVRRDPEDDT